MDIPAHNGVAIPIMTAAPDWNGDVGLRVIHETGVFEALDLSEERHQRRPRPLYGIRFSTTTLSQQEQGTLRKRFETAQATPFGVPLWTETVHLTEDVNSGSDTLTVSSSQDTLFQVFPYALIWRDFQTWELIQLSSAALENHFELASGTVGDWRENDLVIPVAFGYLKRPDFAAIDADNSGVDIDFEERFLFQWQDRIERPSVSTPVLTYSEPGCLDTFTVDFGEPISGLKRFIVEHSDDRGGPWDFYCYGRRESGQLAFNNYFRGEKWIRISLLWLDLSISEGVYIFKPDASVLTAPTITIPDLNTSVSVPNAANFMGHSGADRTKEVVVVNAANQIDYNGKAIMSVPCGAAFIEISDRQQYDMATLSDPQTPSTMTVTLDSPDEDAVVRFTTDGTTPNSPTDGFASGTSVNPAADSFGCVIIARSFKGGCKSPLSYFLIDKSIGVLANVNTFGKQVLTVSSCQMNTFYKAKESPESDCSLFVTVNSCESVLAALPGSAGTEPNEDGPGLENWIEASYENWRDHQTAGTDGTSGHRIWQDDGGWIRSNAEFESFACEEGGDGPGNPWRHGDLALTASYFNLLQLQWGGSDPGINANFKAFPSIFTYCVLSQTDAIEGAAGVYIGTLATSFFGNPDLAGDMHNAFVGTDGVEIAADRKKEAKSIGKNVSMDALAFVACRIPSPAADLWNPDDVV